jgi:hypothetical protein
LKRWFLTIAPHAFIWKIHGSIDSSCAYDIWGIIKKIEETIFKWALLIQQHWAKSSI